MKTTLLVLLIASSAAAATGVSVRDLARDERIAVEFRSRGCFHNERYRFDLEGGDTVVVRSSNDRTVQLSSAERAGLDRLLQFYRKGQEGLCTTQDSVTMTYFRGGRKVATERYTDGTCATYDMKSVTTFRDIGRKLGLTTP